MAGIAVYHVQRLREGAVPHKKLHFEKVEPSPAFSFLAYTMHVDLFFPSVVLFTIFICQNGQREGSRMIRKHLVFKDMLRCRFIFFPDFQGGNRSLLCNELQRVRPQTENLGCQCRSSCRIFLFCSFQQNVTFAYSYEVSFSKYFSYCLVKFIYRL